MTPSKKIALSALLVGVLAGVSALGVFGLFTATTQNAGNEISTGTVALADNDAGSALLNITGAKPGDSWTRCIKVTYNGSLPATVHSWMQDVTGPLAAYVHLTLIQGTQASATFPDCTGFTPDAVGQVYDGPLNGLVGTSYDTGVPSSPAGQTGWNPGDSLVLKSITSLSSAAPDGVQAASTGVFSMHFEAHSG
jgi:hypothetical protein